MHRWCCACCWNHVNMHRWCCACCWNHVNMHRWCCPGLPNRVYSADGIECMPHTLDSWPYTLCQTMFFHCVFQCFGRIHSILAAYTRLPYTLECIRPAMFWGGRVYSAFVILPDTLYFGRIHSIRPCTFYFGRIHSTRVYSARPKTLAVYTRSKKTQKNVKMPRYLQFPIHMGISR